MANAVYGCDRRVRASVVNGDGMDGMQDDTYDVSTDDDGLKGAADAQALSYVTFVFTNCLLLLVALCLY